MLWNYEQIFCWIGLNVKFEKVRQPFIYYLEDNSNHLRATWLTYVDL